ncbi:MAG: ribonuclease H-like domain-containing protein [Ignavibacteria bacterium]|nr:ribonuclease H-like domain-containing protein [Ignavibacteria bacterium]
MLDITNRKIIVFDIECAPYDFESHYDEETKKYLLKYAEGDAGKEKAAIESLVFSPFTSQVVAIGVIDYNRYIDYKSKKEKKEEYEKNIGTILVNAPHDFELNLETEKIKYVCGKEEILLEQFWKVMEEFKYNLLVTFNGREFDCPFLMLRSLILGIKPAYNLMKGSDFTFKDNHIDLLKEFTFYRHSPTGARRKYSLDFYCKQLGIISPKEEGVTGDMVGELFNKKEYQQIADYCMRDVIAETELFKKWNELFNI